MSLLWRLVINTAAIMVAAYLLPGVAVSSFWVALVVAIVLGIINIFLKPILVILTLPLTFITFGLFLLVINAVLILLAGAIVEGFEVDGFWWAVLFSVVLSIINSFLSSLSKSRNHSQTTYLR
ncbi:MAG TPA: phage holin family protein [Verrucomicrobiae bacterium]|nr:phage holin family protein [Verrucomicrobiae bacterium]